MASPGGGKGPPLNTPTPLPSETFQYESRLLATQQRKKHAEYDAQLLANRIALLKKEVRWSGPRPRAFGHGAPWRQPVRVTCSCTVRGRAGRLASTDILKSLPPHDPYYAGS